MQFSEVMTTNEAMEYLKVTRKTLLKLVKKNQIKAAKVGKDYRYLKVEIDKFLRGEKEETLF
ncbi:MAG: helix-turn-helix domain-containing protein [bacterium]|nr:helix-turn-helix domain-containing protein [bacterium]MBU1918579.1 helix-turn-helix domain-containing protein [bacterium]